MAKSITEVKFHTGPMTRRRHIDKQDSKYHYYYARNDPDRIRDLCDLFDYEVVHRDEKGEHGDKSLVGAVTAGGDVLLRCPIEAWNSREKEKAAARKAQLEGPRQTFKTEAAKSGVETIDSTKSSRGPMSSIVK